MKKSRLSILSLSLLLAVSGLAFGVDIADTRLLSQPAPGDGCLVFAYADDLWVVGADGGNARRLTSNPGVESNPAVSPDGKTVAFSGQYDGNTDVFVVPIEGGVPRRLTWHPGEDVVQGFTPDGKSVLFTSGRNSFQPAYRRFYTVPLNGGFPEPLEIPNAFKGSISPDGKFIAYNPFHEAFVQWKNYRGGTFSRIWIFNNSDHSIRKIPQPKGRSNDVGPMWAGGLIYFRSDRNGEFNLFSFDPASNEVRQVTFHEDFPVLGASIRGNRIVYEQAGSLNIYDIAAKKSVQLRIGVAADLPEVRERFAQGAKWIRDASISPTGARAAFEFRGEIVTVPAEKGDPRNVTGTPGAHERSPIWSPDGKSIAYFSDATGEYALYVRSQDGKGEARIYPLKGAGFYETPVFSPDSKKICFNDNSQSLYWIDLDSGIVKKIGSEFLYGPAMMKTLRPNWSPDSRWLAYTLNNATNFQKVYVYSLERDAAFPITDGLSEASEPVFDASGKYLYFCGSTNAGPVKQWFDQSMADIRMTNSLYLVVLGKNVPSPLAKESDEEKTAVSDKKEEGQFPGRAGKPAKGAIEADKPAASVSIDFEGLDRRILALPLPSGRYWNLQPGDAGKLYFEDESWTGVGAAIGIASAPSNLHLFDLEKRKDEVLMSDVNLCLLSADKKKFLLLSGETWSIVPSVGKPQPGQGRLATEAVSVRINPREEWKQIFDEAWRINRDYFYDPGMHGADWKAMKSKYAVFLPHLACRSDLNRVIQWMCSELAVGHHRVAGGDMQERPKSVPVGLLGADWEIANGRYRFKKVYGGLNWNPELRSPLTEPGVDVKEGEYLLAVNGRDVRLPDNVYSFFENTADKIVEITVGPNPDGTGSRTVKAVPVVSEGGLRNRDWVEGNLKKVSEATNNRVAYVYVPNTAELGHVYFKRYFFPQSDREAIIVDERFNGGGSLADYYIDNLRKPLIAYWAMRYGADLKTPSASIQGPKVMLINECAGSGGDLLPWMWRKFRTRETGRDNHLGWGLWACLGFPVLHGRAGISRLPTSPSGTKTGFIVENVGVPPDIEVETDAGRCHRRSRSPARESHLDHPGGTQGESTGQGEAASVPDQSPQGAGKMSADEEDSDAACGSLLSERGDVHSEKRRG